MLNRIPMIFDSIYLVLFVQNRGAGSLAGTRPSWG